MDEIKHDFEDARRLLDEYLSGEKNFERIAAAGELMVKSVSAGGKIITCGNGGSMCDAMHFAEELTGRFRENRGPVPAVAVSDPSHITCTANDYGYEQIFSRFVEGLGRKGDVLLAISTSGNSANVIKAAETACMMGIKVVALTGGEEGELAGHCDIELRAPASPYPDRIQEIHIKIIHALVKYIEKKL